MRILAYRLPELQDQVAKFNKKAAKWGLPPVEVNILETKVEERTQLIQDEDGGDPAEHKFKIEVVYLEIKGETPRLSGWSIHSKIQPSDVAGNNFVFTAPNQAPVESLRTCPLNCEHCHTNRWRKTCYLVQHEDGRQALVGSTCMKDYLPAINVESLMQYLDNFAKIGLGPDEDNPPRGEHVYNTDHALRDALVSIRNYGFVSKAKAETSDLQPTSWDIDPSNKKRAELYKGLDKEALEDLDKEVQECKTYLLAKSDAGNDFIYNVKLALQADYCKPKLYGYLAAAVNVWLRETEEAAEKAAEQLNEHFGALGARITIHQLKLVGITATEGGWGTTLIHRFTDKEGRLFVWFASKRLGEVGQTFNLKATIKNHDVFKGRKQTIITRCNEV